MFTTLKFLLWSDGYHVQLTHIPKRNCFAAVNNLVTNDPGILSNDVYAHFTADAGVLNGTNAHNCVRV